MIQTLQVEYVIIGPFSFDFGFICISVFFKRYQTGECILSFLKKHKSANKFQIEGEKWYKTPLCYTWVCQSCAHELRRLIGFHIFYYLQDNLSAPFSEIFAFISVFVFLLFSSFLHCVYKRLHCFQPIRFKNIFCIN